METNQPASIFILAPLLTRWGLERLLQSAGGLQIAGSSAALATAAEEVAAKFPDIVVVDAEHYPLDQARALIEHSCGNIIGLVTGADPTSQSTHPGCLSMRAHPAAFVRTVMQLAGTQGRSRPQGLAQPAQPAYLHAARPARNATCQVEALTPKQREIVRAISVHACSPAKVIADKLHISEHTLRNHLSEIYSRLGVTRRTHLQALVAGQLDAFAPESGLWNA